MATGKEWLDEINSMTKDELTMALSAFEQLSEWKFFKEQFQFRQFSFVVEMKERIEHLAEIEANEDSTAPIQ